jgi:nicotinamidase-related amidase
MQELSDEHRRDPIADITLIGLCTDICVISNAMLLKAALPEIDIIIDAACCAGVTPEGHATALHAMRACQIIIENV